MTQQTLATKLLTGKKIAFETFAYPAELKDAAEVATAVGFPPPQVFKTLVVQPPDGDPRAKPMLVMVPAPQQLDLKKLAKSIGVKKLKMATQREAEAMTGLQVGGISALALLNKGFAVYIDQSARDLGDVVISAGERGLQIKLAVADLVKLTRARFADVASAA